MYSKICDVIDKVIRAVIAVVFATMIVACVAQVFFRFVLNNSLSWSEELARYTFIWTTCLGATICFRKGSHATVTLLYDRFKGNAKKIIDTIINLVILSSSTVLTIYGFNVVGKVIGQASPALHISMALPYISIPICGIVLIFYVIEKLINIYKPAKKEVTE